MQAGPGERLHYFITPDQAQYSVDIYWALKASNANVPKEVEELANGEFLS